MRVETFVRGPLLNNVYLLWDEHSNEAAIIDPGIQSDDLLQNIQDLQLNLRYVLNTHRHFDHVDNDEFYREQTGAPIVLHQDDAAMLKDQLGIEPDMLLQGGEELALGGLTIRTLHTPGHSAGGMCFLVEDHLFAGDTLFAGSVGRSDFEDSDGELLLKVIAEKILPLPDATRVLPGHGDETTVGAERAGNPFLQGFVG
ncbi:MAG: MBL fold metallo-hydrolase [Chloroflexi bacterium]|nr:MBL fold metallo-hydrolase [Chloroflexota bacterium]